MNSSKRAPVRKAALELSRSRMAPPAERMVPTRRSAMTSWALNVTGAGIVAMYRSIQDSSVPHPRIEQRVEQVDGQRRGGDTHDGEDRNAHDHVEVRLQDGRIQ